jgi:hypothetical protein
MSARRMKKYYVNSQHPIPNAQRLPNPDCQWVGPVSMGGDEWDADQRLMISKLPDEGFSLE